MQAISHSTEAGYQTTALGQQHTTSTSTTTNPTSQPQLQERRSQNRRFFSDRFQARTHEAWGGTNMAFLESIVASDFPHFRSMLKNDGPNLNQATLAYHTALTLAADRNETAMVARLLKHGADVNSLDRSGSTALFKAAENGNVSMAKKLIRHGASIKHRNGDGMTALHCAVRGGHVELVNKLIEAGADVNIADDIHGDTPLSWAARAGNVEMLETLMAAQGIDRGHRNVNGEDALAIAARNGHAEAVRYLAGKGMALEQFNQEGMTPLLLAAREGHAEVVQALKEAGADLNRADGKGNTPLITAVQNGHVYVVAKLVELGADMNLSDREGNTALIWASLKNDAKLIDAVMLGWEKLDKNCRNAQGDTALTVAVKGGWGDAVAALLKWSFDINRPDSAGNTPLMCAADSGIPSMVELLLSTKQKIHVLKKNNEGKSALEIAAKNCDGSTFKKVLLLYVSPEEVRELQRADNGWAWIDFKWGLASVGMEKVATFMKERRGLI